GWSLKHLHRLIVTSATYRQSAHVDSQRAEHNRGLDLDPQNALMWHAQRQRLSGEALRDAMLQVSGALNLKMFGPSAKPELPTNVGPGAWEPDARPEDRNRRSVYVLVKRNLRYPLFEAFDSPAREESCPRRDNTITAGQSLVLLNSSFSYGCAQGWAQRLVGASGKDVGALIELAYDEAFCRAPSDEERLAAKVFLERMDQLRHDETSRASSDVESLKAFVDFCHVLFNSNEFLYVD
ncbi:MAG TPA: DUF1553 domain-containing protein, partial [Pirellulales bacterium]|nr:DUF1553 domain-containing protein [Pirellulales bacterium]